MHTARPAYVYQCIFVFLQDGLYIFDWKNRLRLMYSRAVALENFAGAKIESDLDSDSSEFFATEFVAV